MVAFNKIKNYNSNEKFVNIYGNIIYATIKKHNNVISVTVTQNSKVYSYLIFYILLLLSNIASFQLNLISTAVFVIIFIILNTFIYTKSGSIIEETFISIKPLGYQIITKYVIGQKSRFIPHERVQNIFINEVIFKQKVIYLLTILAKGSNEDELIPLFTGCKPRLKCLEHIYNTVCNG